MTEPKKLSITMERGLRDAGFTEYALAIAGAAAWVVLGTFLYINATYPAQCPGDTFVDAYMCSPELPLSGTLVESGLFLWLWATPMLLILELRRHTRRRRGNNVSLRSHRQEKRDRQDGLID